MNNFISDSIFLSMIVCLMSITLLAQEETEEPEAVVIERVALSLTPPEKYSIALKLEPVHSVPVVAPTDGIVKDVYAKIGDLTAKNAELIRLDSQEYSLALKIAEAELELAKVELERAASDGNAKPVAAASLQVAQRKLDLARYRVDNTILHSVIDGNVTELFVTQGQYVRAGDLLATIIDPTQLYVDIPVEREQANTGAKLPLTIESETTEAQIATILAPLPEFDPLRELFVSVATARVLVDSKGGQFTTGQSVNSKMIPRYPIAEIQTLAIRTATEDPDAERSVQVIRDGFVRNIPIQVLGQVGQTHVFVSGRFSEGDELIISNSQPLKDGSWVRPMLLKNPENQSRQNSLPTPNRVPNPGAGF